MTTEQTNKKVGFDPRKRSAARLAAVQALYEIEISGAEVDPVVQDFLAKRWAQPAINEDGNEVELTEFDSAFFSEIVKGVRTNYSSLDEMIEGTLQNEWTLARIETLLKCMLRAGIYELAHHADTPKGVIINEYMDVANAFFTEGEPKMLNGILDKLGKVLREPD
ncbi:MAG: transcription antitermination factor NusB [Rhodospirillaceae bacterium]|nr:transcription antitermination factor NusB [Rhodospirillaceae bacterium]